MVSEATLREIRAVSAENEARGNAELAARDQRLLLLRALSDLVAGLHMPVALGIPLGTARKAYSDVRNELGDFGYSTAEEIEVRLRRILGGGMA